MDVSTAAPVIGLAIGALIGCIGIGGGALMMPVLLLGFGLDPVSAVGTDLVFASTTKAFGVLEHARLKTIDWPKVKALATGSVPAMILTSGMLAWFVSDNPAWANEVLGRLVGLTILGVALSSILRFRVSASHQESGLTSRVHRSQHVVLPAIGFGVGILVALTSIGSGILVALAFTVLFGLSARQIVGTDIAHGVLVTSVGAVLHGFGGNVQWPIVMSLLLGAIPGVFLGARLSVGLPDAVVRAGIMIALVLTGVSLVQVGV
jgi:uncharacterized membrane protein YfcA